MTTPNGAILFNSSTGSDTQASGLGPATAVFGTTGTSTSASAVVTGINTTGVSAGDLFWGDTSTGRQFSIIASVDSGTQVTLDDNLTASHAGNLTWAIGGKRATFDNADSRTIFSSTGWKDGWIIETESDQTLNSTTMGFVTVNGTVRGASGAVRTINQTANAAVFLAQSGNTACVIFENLKFTNSNGTKSSAFGLQQFTSTRVVFRVRDCVFGDATNTLAEGIRSNSTLGGVLAFNSSFVSCTTEGIAIDSNDGFVFCFGCSFLNNAVHVQYTLSVRAAFFVACTFSGATADGFNITNSALAAFVFCHFYDATGDGCQVTHSTGGAHVFAGNTFVENGAYGINVTVPHVNWLMSLFNAFYANTSGEITGGPNGAGDITLTANPYVDGVAGDFNINNTAGGGAVLRGTTKVLP